jgi:hypothetical protein
MHDFRRAAARNLLRAGVDQSTATQILEHETAEVFRRYAIEDERVLREAADRLNRAASRTRNAHRVAPGRWTRDGRSANSLISLLCRSGGMADAPDSKSGTGNRVWVQVPPPALRKLRHFAGLRPIRRDRHLGELQPFTAISKPSRQHYVSTRGRAGCSFIQTPPASRLGNRAPKGADPRA